MNIEIPEKYRLLVGTVHILQGNVFGRKKLEPKEYDIIGIRLGSATIMNVKEMMEKGESTYEHPTFELLIKNDQMRQARWTNGMPIREINLKDLEKEEATV